LRVSGIASIDDPKRALELLLAQAKVGITELPGLLILR
jgi:transmembrane sensor